MRRKKTTPNRPVVSKGPSHNGNGGNGLKNSGQKASAGSTPRTPDDGEPVGEDEEFLEKDEPEEPGPEVTAEDWADLNLEEPLDLLENSVVAIELSEDPVRLYLKEIGQINLLDADSEFRLAARIEAAAPRSKACKSTSNPSQPQRYQALYASDRPRPDHSWGRLVEDATTSSRATSRT